MEIISRISSPLSEPWVAWLLLLLLLLWTFNQMFLPEIAAVCRGFLSRGDRTFTVHTVQTKYTSRIYKLGIIALVLQMYILGETNNFSLADYGKTLAVITAIGLAQWMSIHLVGIVFLNHRHMENAMEQRDIISNALYGLAPLIVLTQLWGAYMATNILVIFVGIVYFGLIIIKAFQLFYNNLLSIIYILLYIISLEFIPLAAMIIWTKNIVQ